MVKLPNTINGIVVPTTVNFWKHQGENVATPDTQKITRKATKKEIQNSLNKAKNALAIFGGFTVTKQSGGWLDVDSGALVEEDNYLVWSYSYADSDQLTSLELVAQSIGADMLQDSMLVIRNSEPYLV